MGHLHCRSQNIIYEKVLADSIEDYEMLFSPLSPTDSTLLKILLKWELGESDITEEITQQMSELSFLLKQLPHAAIHATYYCLDDEAFSFRFHLHRGERIHYILSHSIENLHSFKIANIVDPTINPLNGKGTLILELLK